ncbi:MAG: class I SAM-dependent methyltransferase [Acidobacteria bacterium]|nr:class I SAM-dependent methyltransferase [Acidobacteriota bacterium]
MSTLKTDKKLAFLHDLYVATDWGERFAELIDEHVKLPSKGRAIYVAAGTGGHALALKKRAGQGVTFVCVDESEARLELSRVKAAAVKESGAEFQHGQLEALSFEDEQFDLVVGDASLVAPERLPEMLSEMVRVAAPGATVALNLTTASSFGEFFSVYWEALANTGHAEQAAGVEALISALPTVSDVEVLAGREALNDVQSWTRTEEFDFASGEAFLSAPLVRDFLLGNWLEFLPEDEATRAEVLGEVERIIDDERQGADYTLSIKATIIVGRKAE